MIKKGFNLYTTSPLVVVDAVCKGKKPYCCEVCTSPFLYLCKPICKFRRATLSEFVEYRLNLRKGGKRGYER